MGKPRESKAAAKAEEEGVSHNGNKVEKKKNLQPTEKIIPKKVTRGSAKPAPAESASSGSQSEAEEPVATKTAKPAEKAEDWSSGSSSEAEEAPKAKATPAKKPATEVKTPSAKATKAASAASSTPATKSKPKAEEASKKEPAAAAAAAAAEAKPAQSVPQKRPAEDDGYLPSSRRLAWRTNAERLGKFLEGLQVTVHQIDILIENGRSRGLGFVIVDKEDALPLIEKSPHEIDGRMVTFNYNTSDLLRKRWVSDTPRPTLLVKCLSANTTTEHLKAHFQGSINARLATEFSTGTSKCYGFVDYPDINSATTALNKYHHSILNGRTILVEYSQNKPGQRKKKD